MSAPVCRACYAATLTPDERDRLNSEEVTGCVYYCPEHQGVLDNYMKEMDLWKVVRLRPMGDWSYERH